MTVSCAIGLSQDRRGDARRGLVADRPKRKAFSFELVFADEVVGKGDFHGGEFADEGPGFVRGERGFEGDEGTAQDGEVAVEVYVFGAGGIFFEEGIAHPVVSDLAASPVAADQPGEELSAARRVAAQVVGGGLAGLLGSGFAGAVFFRHGEGSHVGQADVQRFGGEDFYRARIESPVLAVECLTGKRGESVAAVFTA